MIQSPQSSDASFFQLSIGPQAQGPSSQRASPSREFDPSVSQVWSSPTSSLDCEALRRFRDWEPSSQISQFVNDLNYVPTDLPPLNVLGYHEKEDTKGGKDGEQCKPENVDEELVFHEVSTQTWCKRLLYSPFAYIVRFLFLIPIPVKSCRMAQGIQLHSQTRCHHRRPHSSIQVIMATP